MRPWKLYLLVALLGLFALTACKKKGMVLLSDHWVKVQLKVDGRFDLLKIRQLTLVIDSATDGGPNLGLPELCDDVARSGTDGKCSVTCEDYDNDGHREFVVDCTGEAGTLLTGRVWEYWLFGTPIENPTKFKLRAYLRGLQGLLGSGETSSDMNGNSISITSGANSTARINVACIPGRSCTGDVDPQCQLDVNGPASPSVNEGTTSQYTYTASDKPGLGHSWDVKLASGEDAPYWISLASINETQALLTLAPPVGLAMTQPSTQLLLQVSNEDCSKSMNVTASVKETNQPPVLAELSNLTVQAGMSSTYYLAAYDPDIGDALTYSLSGNPDWVRVAPVQGSPPRHAWLVIAPPEGTSGNFGPITVKVTDSGTPPMSDTSIFSVATEATLSNSAPVLHPVGNLTVAAGATLDITISADDSDADDGLTFSLTNQPPWATLPSQSNRQATLRLAPPMGTHSNWPGLTIRVTDEHGAANQETVTVLLNAHMTRPVLSAIADQTVTEGAPAPTLITVSATDPDPGETFAFSLQNNPHWVTVLDTNTSDNQAIVRIQAPAGSRGIYRDIIVQVRDGAGLADWKRFSLNVTDGNAAPVLTAIGNHLCPPGQQTDVPLSAVDPDGDVVTFSVDEAAPGWVTIVDVDGSDSRALLRGTPPAGTTGSFGVTVTARDSLGASAVETIQLLVGVACHAPILRTIGRQYLYPGEHRVMELRATDADAAEVLSFSLRDAPSWIQLIDNGNRTARLELSVPPTLPTGVHPGGTVMVTDPCAHGPLSDTEALEFVVGRVNRCPDMVPIAPVSVMEADSATVALSVLDLDGDKVELAVDATSPAWITVNSYTFSGYQGTGSLRIAPPLGSAGIHEVSLVLSESGKTSPCTTVATFTVNVAAWQNHPPLLTAVGPLSLKENATLVVSLSASDPDGAQSLHFLTGAGSPSWAEASGSGTSGEGNTVTGTLHLKPGPDDRGQYTVFLQVTDGLATVQEAVQVSVEEGTDVPANVTASDGTSTDHVEVSWTAVAGADRYYIYRADIENGSYAELGHVAASPYTDATATAGTKYYYQVKAFDSSTGSYSQPSAPDDGYRALGMLAGVTASDGTATTHVEVSWNSLRNADSYQIFRADSAGGSYAQIGTSTTSPYQDTSATPGVLYHYKARAYAASSDSSGAFSFPDPGFRGLAAPAGVTASDGTSATSVEVAWAAVTGADRYHVFRAFSDGGFSEIGSVDETTYADTSARPGQAYHYKLKAYAASADTYSDFSQSDTGFLKLSTPRNVSATQGTYTDKVEVSWSGVAGADSYTLFRAAGAGGSYAELTTTSSATYSDKSTSAGVAYYYKVRADSQSTGSSELSSAALGYNGLLRPAGVTASQGTSLDHVTINWDAVTGADKYYVYRSPHGEGGYTEIASTTTQTHDDTTAVPGTKYYYQVKAQSAFFGMSSSSDHATGYRKLATPTALSASDGTSGAHVAVSWSGVTGADSYKVYRAGSAGGTYVELGSSQGSPYNDTTAEPGVVYYYKAKAYASSSDSTSDFTAHDDGFRGIGAPTGVAASDGTSTTQVVVSWNAVSGADNYKVFRAVSADSSYSELTTLTASPYNDLTATPGIKYYYKLQSHAASSGTWSAFSSADDGFRRLLAPTDVVASDGTSTSSTEVTWTAAAHADRYYIYRQEVIKSGYDELGYVTGAVSYDDTTAVPGQDYLYLVRSYATSSSSYSGDSNTDTGYRKLSPPTNIAASQGTSSTQITLTWTASPGATGYHISRHDGGDGGWEELNPVTSSPYIDTSVTPGRRYTYKLKAYSSVTQTYSEESDSVSGYAKLGTPTNLAASDGTYTGYVRLSWSYLPGASTYYIYRSTSATGTYTELGTDYSSPYNDMTAEPGQKYYYKIKAYASSSQTYSDFSNYDDGYRNLEAPTGVAASDGTSTAHVQVSWTGVSGATRYHLHRATSASGVYTDIGTDTASPYNDTTADPGTKYYYKVRAYNSATQTYSNYSAYDDGYRKLSPPTNVTATDGTSTATVTVTWTGVPGATRYDAYYATSATGTYYMSGTHTGTTHSHTAALPGQQYYYKVKAYSSSSTDFSDFSGYDAGYRKLSPPTNLTASDGTSTSHVTVNWSSVQGASLYYIHRATSSTGTYSNIGNSTSSAYNDTTAVVGTKYWYKVRAYATSTSTYSDYSSYNDGFRLLSPPTGVSATDGTSTSMVTVSWSAATGATSYYVYRATSSGGAYSLLNDTTSLSYGDTTATPGTRYYYKVRSYSSVTASYSDYSGYNDGYRKLGAPTGVTASDGTSTAQVTVSWNSSSGATRYYVYRATSSGGTYSNIGNTDSTSYNDTSATAGSMYYYKVRAYSSSTSSYSDYSSYNSGYRRLGAPTGVAATDGTYSDKVRVTWSSVTGANRYYVYRATSEGGSYTQVGTYTSSTTLDDTSVPNVNTYYYKVRAYATSSAGYSDYSGPDSGHLERYTLSVEYTGDGGGTVSSNPSGLSCSGNCSAYFTPGTSVALSANGDSSSKFTGFWKDGRLKSTRTYNLVMSADQLVKAKFEANKYYMFVTSTEYSGSQIGGLTGADSKCNSRASAGGLPGTYVAWLSTTSVNAKDRLPSSGGWMRPDGKPYANSKSDLLAGKIHYPPNVDELGNEISSSTSVWTGTLDSGNRTSLRCGDWTTTSGDGYGGYCTATRQGWTAYFSSTCAASNRIYCFGTSSKSAVSPYSAGSIAFASSGSFKAHQGRACADALCQSDAESAGYRGTFLALLATDSATAASRFSSTGNPWYRPDGVQVVDSASQLLSAGQLKAPINVTADGLTYYNWGSQKMWTGSSAVNVIDQGATCNSWSSNSSGLQARNGGAPFTDSGYFNYLSGYQRSACNLTTNRVYCLETNWSNNYVFITSTTQVVGTLGGLSGADTICNTRAQAAGLPGSYVAWLSTSSVNAKDRLGNSGGWVRTDGKPFTNSVDDLLAGKIHYPVQLDEFGHHLGTTASAVTGTNRDGRVSGSATCGNWSSTSGTYRGGYGSATSSSWTSFSTGYSCSAALRFYCFGVNSNNPVVTSACGRYAFITASSFTASGGIGGANALCQSEAGSAGLPGTYKALLATNTASAASHFTARGESVIRPDGVKVADSDSDLLGGVQLVAPINVTAEGTTYYNWEYQKAWTGSDAINTTDSGATCNNWSTTSSSREARNGGAPFTHSYWFNYLNGYQQSACNTTTNKVYCLQE